jgi:hypothetical protein
MSALAEIERKVKEAKRAVEQIGYSAEPVSAKEFYDCMTGEIFSDDVTTLHDVLDNEFLMIHEFVEISELKKRGRAIDKRVIVESPKTDLRDLFRGFGMGAQVCAIQERLFVGGKEAGNS